MMDLLSGPVNTYFDRKYEKDQLETLISESLEQMRQQYK